ncbi:MAG: hypothetical protein M0019_04985 [Actinomycetota bacterium]|nr:hypothetical protein [Actinomycetota bacterium]
MPNNYQTAITASKREIKARNNLLRQVIKFVQLNLKMAKMTKMHG